MKNKKTSKAKSEKVSLDLRSDFGEDSNELDTGHVHVDGATDDDDSPIGISWKESKEVFKQDEKKRKEALDFFRSQDKEKRRKKNELFVSQKKAKTNIQAERTYELTKLPEEILLAVAKSPEMDTNKEAKEKMEEKKQKRTGKSPRTRKRKDKVEEELKKPDHYNVLVVKGEVTGSKGIQDSAAAFLENHLYGSRLQRASPSSSLASKHKSCGVMKPALKFSTRA